MFYEKGGLKETLVPEFSFFIKLQSGGLQIYQKRLRYRGLEYQYANITNTDIKDF